MLNFNSNGLLIPNHNIESHILELEKVFVTATRSAKRKELFNNYILYSTSIKELCNYEEFTQWIDGSFVTRKVDPGDIDIVTFIDFSIVNALNKDLSDYKSPASQTIFGVDAYIVKVYPAGHKLYPAYLADRAYWLAYFTKTRRNRIGNKHRKGFLEINM